MHLLFPILSITVQYYKSKYKEKFVTMDKKWFFLIVALSVYGFPLPWITEKGDFIRGSEVFKHQFNDMFFDFSRLAINFLIFFLLHKLLNRRKNLKRDQELKL